MLALADKAETPPGGWTCYVGGTTIRAFSYVSLLNKSIFEAERQGIPLPLDKVEWFENELCHQNSLVKCEVVAPVTAETRRLSAGDALRFLRLVKEWLLSSGAELVSQPEADRRSEICASCPYNVPMHGCSVCKGIAAKIFEIRGKLTSRFDSQLEGCAVCGCVNQAQIHVPLSVLKVGVTPEMQFPPWCWKKSVAA